MDVQSYLKSCQDNVNESLNNKLPLETAIPNKLHQSMRYTVLNGGKRLRSAFIYATGEALGAEKEILTDVCVAIELIHAYSLIHDDLPALDNDDLRRGKPTCHKVFGEATAILTGDALQSLAFETIASIKNINPKFVLEMIRLLSGAIGSRGMIGGEELDIEMLNQSAIVAEVERMYQLKTGCLLSAGSQLAALAANCTDETVLSHLQQFGTCIGISFQIHDDIIGIESDTAVLGKKQNADLDLNKPVYPALVGMADAKKKRDALFYQALDHLKGAGCYNETLEALSRYVITRVC